MLTSSYISMFLLGFAGSLHCVGMCGPLQSFITRATITYKVLYHYGRYIAYMITGILFFFLGAASHIMGLQKYITILSGIIVILTLLPYQMPIKLQLHTLTQRLFKGASKRDITQRYLFMGLANGFLPCGMVYMAATQAMLAQSLVHTLLLMLVFLMGTLPALLGINYLYAVLENGRFYVSKLKPLVVLSIGVLLILRGLKASGNNEPQSPKMCTYSVK